jgi:hypothetical protein
MSCCSHHTANSGEFWRSRVERSGKGGVRRPQIVGGPELGHDASGLLGPSPAEEVPRLGVEQQ